MIKKECSNFCDYVAIHERKEIENFLLIPNALDRAAVRRLEDHNRRSGKSIQYSSSASKILRSLCEEKKNYVMAQQLAARRKHEKAIGSGMHEASIDEAALQEFEDVWSTFDTMLRVVPGKDILSGFNKHLQDTYGISLTPTAIIDAMSLQEVPAEMHALISSISNLSKSASGDVAT